MTPVINAAKAAAIAARTARENAAAAKEKGPAKTDSRWQRRLRRRRRRRANLRNKFGADLREERKRRREEAERDRIYEESQRMYKERYGDDGKEHSKGPGNENQAKPDGSAPNGDSAYRQVLDYYRSKPVGTELGNPRNPKDNKHGVYLDGPFKGHTPAELPYLVRERWDSGTIGQPESNSRLTPRPKTPSEILEAKREFLKTHAMDADLGPDPAAQGGGRQAGAAAESANANARQGQMQNRVNQNPDAYENDSMQSLRMTENYGGS